MEGEASMSLNIREMLTGNPARLRYVFRYSTSRVQHPESVAEHSFYVAFYCLMIWRWLEDNSPDEINTHYDSGKGELLERALLHDLEEARTGDFPRPFKHSNTSLKEMLSDASRMAMSDILERLVGSGQQKCDMFDIWDDAKYEDIPGLILEFADFLAVLSFMCEEGAGAGNRSISEHVREMDKYFDIFASEKFDFIRPLIDQTIEIMKEVFPGEYSSFRKEER